MARSPASGREEIKARLRKIGTAPEAQFALDLLDATPVAPEDDFFWAVDNFHNNLAGATFALKLLVHAKAARNDLAKRILLAIKRGAVPGNPSKNSNYCLIPGNEEVREQRFVALEAANGDIDKATACLATVALSDQEILQIMNSKPYWSNNHAADNVVSPKAKIRNRLLNNDNITETSCVVGGKALFQAPSMGRQNRLRRGS